jgi:hypothetical protein
MLKTIRVVDPKVDILSDVQQNHIVLQGGQRVTEDVISANSWQTTPTNSLFTINPPSTQTIVDKAIKLRCYVKITTDQAMQLGIHDALRQFPLNSIIDVSSCQINGQNISENSGDKVHALATYGVSLDDTSKMSSMTPSYPDQYQDYSLTLGSGKNALGNYGENGVPSGLRGGFPQESGGFVGATIVEYVLTEYLRLSPFDDGYHEESEGMVNINQINVNLRFKTQLDRIWSHSALGNPITNVQVEFTRPPELLVRYITPQPEQKIPDVQHLNFYSDQDYIKQFTLSPNVSTVVPTDSIKLGQIPECVYIFARHSRASSNYSKADSFCSIESVNITFNNQNGLMSSATKQDLFEMSARNGCTLSYPAWAKYRGSVVKIMFGRDIGLPPFLAAGCQAQAQIRMDVVVKNNGLSVFNGELFTVFRNIGMFSIYENGATASLGNLTPQLVLDAQKSPEVNFQHYKALHGGSFWKKLKNIVGTVAGVASKVAPVASAVLPQYAGAINTIGNVAGKVAGAGLVGGRIRRRRG